MTAYEMCLQLNRRLILGQTVTPGEKKAFIDRVIRSVSSKEEAARFYNSVRFPGNCDAAGNRMYPFFLIPPYNGGKKLPTVTGYQPGTHIVSANSYELEMLRLARIFAGEIMHPQLHNLNDMHSLTVSRLATTCFGSTDDGVGECFEASLLVLRYLIPDSKKNELTIRSRIVNYRKHADEKERSPAVTWYFRLCLSELPADFAPDEIARELPLIQQTGDELFDAIGRKLISMS